MKRKRKSSASKIGSCKRKKIIENDNNNTEPESECAINSINSDSDMSQSFKCVFCNRTFSTHQEMLTHFQNLCKDKSSSAIDSDSIIPCDWCSLSFDSLPAAMKHKWSKHKYDAHNYNCQHCGNMFTFKIMLDRHVQKLHTEEYITDETSECNICSMKFTKQEALDKHIKTVHLVQQLHRERSFFIPGPSSQITINSAKETVSIYYCHWCGTNYTQKYHLGNHLFDHHNSKLYAIPEEIITCHICDAVFFCQKAFDVHNRHSVNDCFISSDKERKMLNMKQELDYGPVSEYLQEDIEEVPEKLE